MSFAMCNHRVPAGLCPVCDSGARKIERYLSPTGDSVLAAEAVHRLAAELASAGLKYAAADLSNTAALVALTGTLDAMRAETLAWRSCVVELINVASAWPDRTVAKHVLGWSRTIH
jgi:hypothetical protein